MMISKASEYSRSIFVFGSNQAGRHGKGTAFTARLHHGAIYGQGEGLQGDSYGITTKDGLIRTLPYQAVKASVDRFIIFAQKHPDWEFMVTPVGCGLAGYEHDEIAPMFLNAPSNCVLPHKWKMIDYKHVTRFWNC